MHRRWLPVLRCPVTGAPYDLDETRAAGEEVGEGFLVSRERREVRPILAGVAVLPRDLRAHLAAFGNVYERMPLADSRVVRFVLGRLGRLQHDVVPFDELVGHYADLLPVDAVSSPPDPAVDDAALSRLLAELGPQTEPALYVGCGTGRGAFVLRSWCPAVVGADRSLARVRRARNVAATQAAFFLPPPPGSGRNEVALELDRLDREGVDFVVADPEHLPFADGAFGLVVLRRQDGFGAYADSSQAAAEASRVLAEDGILVLEADAPSPAGTGWAGVSSSALFAAWSRA